MDVSKYCIDNDITQDPNVGVDAFTQCVNGELNARALGFVRSIAKSNPKGLQKLICKLQQLQVALDPQHLHLVVDALTDQFNLPNCAMHTIQHFLHHSNQRDLIQELKQLSTQYDSPLIQSTLYMMDKLALFSDNTVDHQFLRLVISIMIQWASVKQYCNAKDGARWLKSVLAIPRKSDMAQIITLISEHIHLSTCIIQGGTRHMDCMELFFLLRNISTNDNFAMLSDSNKQMINDMHAVILTTIICKHAPSAFYDIVAMQESHPKYTFLSSCHTYPTKTSYLNDFFQDTHLFTHYFQVRDLQHNTNQQAFLTSLLSNMHDLLYRDTNNDNPSIQTYKRFLEQCKEQINRLDTETFMLWLEINSVEQNVHEGLSTLLLQTHQLTVSKNMHHSGRIRASARQLVSLGLSHRSVFAIQTGTFQPLVNTDIIDIDVINTNAIIRFFDEHAPTVQKKITQELFLLLTLYARNVQSHQLINGVNMNAYPSLQFFQANKGVATIPQTYRPNPLKQDRSDKTTHKSTSASAQLEEAVTLSGNPYTKFSRQS